MMRIAPRTMPVLAIEADYHVPAQCFDGSGFASGNVPPAWPNDPTAACCRCNPFQPPPTGLYLGPGPLRRTAHKPSWLAEPPGVIPR